MAMIKTALKKWTHPARFPAATRATHIAGSLLLLLLLSLALPKPPGATGIANYLPLHMALETLSIIITALIFATIWSLRRSALSNRMLWLGSGFLGVAILDFSHMLSYQGMPDFITPASPEKAIWFWLAARLLAGTSLVVTMALPDRPRPAPNERPPMLYKLLAVLLLVAGLHVIFLLYPDVLPRTFIVGQGLTSAKLQLEALAIMLNLLAAALAFYHLRQNRYYPSAPGLFLAASTMAMAGVFFTVYANVTDIYNLLGHIYKIIADGFLFATIFVRTVKTPYQLLKESQEELQTTLATLPDLLFEMNAEGRYLRVHAGQHSDLAAELHSFIGKKAGDILPPSSSLALEKALTEARNKGESRGVILMVPLAQQQRWYELSIRKKPQANSSEPLFSVLARDITDRRRTADTLHMFSQAVTQSPTPVLLANAAGKIEFVNQAFLSASGYAESDVLRRHFSDFMPVQTRHSLYDDAIATLRKGRTWKGEFTIQGQSGESLIVSALVYPVHDSSWAITHYLAHLEDITEKRRFIEQIRNLSDYDQLTGLPNPAYLKKHFESIHQQHRAMAVLWLNLDAFKTVNDSLGHDAGDALLREVAHRIRGRLRNHDVLIRYSGDSFAILAPERHQDEASALAQELLNEIARPQTLSGSDILLSASIGIALYPSDGTQIQDLLKHSEAAMFRIKSQGGNNYQFFEAKMQKRALRAMALETALKQALKRNELHLVYQPQYTLASKKMLGVEALLRWSSEQFGTVSPAEFIPLAETTTLILPIGHWVLQTALSQLRSWLDNGFPAFNMAVNISAMQFEQANFVEQIREQLASARVPPHLLELELTEAVALRNADVAATRISELKQLGVKLSIDDFGTGYSSLAYLKRFAIQTVKIDQTFVRQLEFNKEDQEIAKAVVQLAHGLSLRTVAEGVETEWQARFLCEIGCYAAQGFYYSHPLTAQQLEHFIRNSQALR